MLAIIAFAALASAMPIATEPNPAPQSATESDNLLATRIASAAMDIVKRSVCDLDADGIANTGSDCPHVNSVLRASFALFCLFAFLIVVHVWQAAKYNKIQAVFGTYIADDMEDVTTKTPYILLDEPGSP
ncbi:hypothetical protein NLG97_g10030 [Lecanicillium saksenae]|uniref:Uncharacterized protein n=1 Tax=Lecanicillium saksenae TaxID=468837 RepID=A0ACC1QIA8_9HYPO|nr:hypothetical protein NLG97_g10030 [Lecanicillium saksenae]